MPRQKRDIYRGVSDPAFDIDRDVDLEYLRRLTEIEEISNADYNMYGVFVRNIIRICLNSHWFRGYPQDVKDDMMSEALYDTLRARRKFDSAKYPQRTAVFNYYWRITYHSCQHVLDNYYKYKNNLFTPASQVGSGAVVYDSSDEFCDDVLEKAVTDWDLIAESLRDSTRGQSQTTKSDQPEGQSQESTETCRSHQDE